MKRYWRLLFWLTFIIVAETTAFSLVPTIQDSIQKASHDPATNITYINVVLISLIIVFSVIVFWKGAIYPYSTALLVWMVKMKNQYITYSYPKLSKYIQIYINTYKYLKRVW